MRGKSLFWNIFALSFPVALLLFGALLWLALFPNVHERERETLERLAWSVRQLADRAAAEWSPDANTADLDAWCVAQGRLVGADVWIVDRAGLVVGNSRNEPDYTRNLSDIPEIRSLIPARGGQTDLEPPRRVASGRGAPTGEDAFFAAVPLRAPLESAAVLILGEPLAAAFPERARMFERLPYLLALLAVGVAALAALVARRLRAPLEDVELWAASVELKGLGARLRVGGPREFESLARGLNNLTEKVSREFREIQRHQKEMEAVFSSMLEGVIAVDVQGTILDINDAAGEILGIERPEIAKGKGVEEVLRKPDLLGFIRRTLNGAPNLEEELGIYAEDGENRILSVHASELCDHDDKRIGTLIVLHDITRLKRLENMRRDFVANVSHELRTPITSIKGFVETLLDGALHDEANAERFLKIVLRHVNRLSAIIEDLLALSSIEKTGESGTVETRRERVRPVLAAAIEMCGPKAQDKKLAIDLQCEPGLFARMKAPLLEQAIVNLLDNAIKYTDPGKSIHVSADRDNASVVIRVRDEGCGIDAPHLKRIFERFYRVDKARSRELGGTGLGLAIVKHIVLAHKGGIEVASEPGKGSTFTIKIPACNNTD